jgi:hypothetical protein
MAAIAAAYASGTITSVSGTTVVISGGAVAGWVGRAIVLTTGNGAGQSRRITAFVSATQITIEFAFANTYTTGVLAGLVDVDPVAGDGFAISHAPADIADGTSIIVDPGTNVMRFVGASSFAGAAFLYLQNWRVEMASSSITCNQALASNRVSFRFGDVDSAGNFYNGCYLHDTATAPSGFGTGAASTADPNFEFYGGIIRCVGAAPFWRLHSDDNIRVRICGVRCNGNIGGRMQGARSVHGDWEVYGNTNASGPFNAKAQFGRITGIRVSGGLQAVYHFWPDSKTLTLEGIDLGPGLTRGIRFANSTTSGERLTIRNIDISQWSALPILYNNGSGTYSNNFRLSQFVNGGYRNAAGTLVADTTRFVLRDNVPATIYDNTVVNGQIPQQEVRYRDMVVLNTGDYNWSTAGGTTYAPYALAAASYLWQPATASLPLLTSTNASLLALPDANVTQTNKATVDAYADIDTLDKLYDRAKSWTVDNLALANPSFGAQLATGNGTELNLGAFNLVVDATAASTFVVAGNTITIKASALAAGTKFATFRTTGTLTLSNGATVGVSYTTGAGSFAAISVTGLVAGSRIQLYNLTDAVEMANLTVAGTSYNAIFPWPGVRTVRLRVSKKGLEDYETTGQFLSGGMSFVSNTPVDSIYDANGIDGSTVTEFAADYPNVQIDINDPDGVTTVPRLHAWYHAICETADGIRNFFGGLVAEDASNYRIVTSILNLKLDNVGGVAVKIGGARLYRDDGTTVIGGGAIEMDPLKSYTSGLGNITILIEELHKLAGLKSGAPMTVTPNTRTVDGITLNITGDGTTSTTVTRA